jgi:hypothetical protein
MPHLRSSVPQMHLMQLLAVRAYEPFGTIRLSLYQFRFAEEHAASIINLHKIILIKPDIYIYIYSNLRFLAMKGRQSILKKITWSTTFVCTHIGQTLGQFTTGSFLIEFQPERYPSVLLTGSFPVSVNWRGSSSI